LGPSSYPRPAAVGVEDEERNVGELEQRAGAVDGGDEGPAAVGDPGEAVPEADAAVEEGQQVGQPIEALRRLGLHHPLERRPGTPRENSEAAIRPGKAAEQQKGRKDRGKFSMLAYTGDRKRASAKMLPAMATGIEEPQLPNLSKTIENFRKQRGEEGGGGEYQQGRRRSRRYHTESS